MTQTTSILVPARNAARTIAETLDSVRAQTSPDWEVIVVDDGSTDDTASIVRRHAELDGRIRLFPGEARGVSAARNTALGHASGRFVLFLDSDDWIAPTFLEEMIARRGSPGEPVVVFCRAQRVTPDGRLAGVLWSPDLVSDPLAIMAKRCAVAIHSVLIERTMLEAVGGFDESLVGCEDWDLWQRIARTGVQFLALERTLAFYRMSVGSLTRNRDRMAMDSRAVIKRGYSPDPRVAHPAPRYVNGASNTASEQATALAWALLWWSAYDFAKPNDLENFLDSDEIAALGADAEWIARTVFDAILLDTVCSPEELADRWDGLIGHIRRSLSILERKTGHFELARRVEYYLEQSVLDAASPAKLRIVGRSAAAEVDMGHIIAIDLPANVDHLRLTFIYGEQRSGALELAVVGPVSAGDVAAAALSELGLRNFSRASGPATASRIGFNLARRLVGQIPALLKTSGRRAVLKACLGGALTDRHGPSTNEGAQRRIFAEAAPSQAARSASAHPAWAASEPSYGRERTQQLPVLMYHQIAADGPEGLARYRTSPEAFHEQMRFLQRHGYHSISAAQAAEHFRTGEPFQGRPVLITFDDGFVDFQDNAWPILQEHGFTAEVFVVTDKVGQTADWDAAYGPPAPLMSAAQLTALAGQGVGLGSHLATHQPADILSSGELASELARSKTAVEAWTGAPTMAFAAPFGIIDKRLLHLLRSGGYAIGFSIENRVAQLIDHQLNLPRLEVVGGWTLEQFAQALGRPIREEPELVSVIIPAHNAEATIEETLDSVLGQTHGNLEVLVVDDGSSDKTAAIVERRMAADSRLGLITQPNAGVAQARNHGAEQAKGAFLAFVDADDLWAPSKIERQLTALQLQGSYAGLAYTWYQSIDENGEVLDISHQPREAGWVVERLCRFNFVGNGSSALVTRDAFVAAGGFDTSLRARSAQGCEDWSFYFKVAEVYDFALVPEPLTGYRQLPNAMSTDAARMLRSADLVAQMMRERHPELADAVRAGNIHFLAWMLRRALVRGRYSEAFELGGVLAARDLAHLAKLAVHVVRDRFGRAARNAPRKFAFLSPNPTGAA